MYLEKGSGIGEYSKVMIVFQGERIVSVKIQRYEIGWCFVDDNWFIAVVE